MVHERSEPPDREGEFESVMDMARKMFGGEPKEWAVPATAAELHERVCRAAEAIGADPETLYSETAANPLELARWLKFIEARKDRLARIGTFLTRNAEAPSFRCPLCRDSAYVSGDARSIYETARFCCCEAGMVAEAGTWARIFYGKFWEKPRKPSARAKRAITEYCRKLNKNEFELRQRIREAEKRRRGKALAIEAEGGEA